LFHYSVFISLGWWCHVAAYVIAVRDEESLFELARHWCKSLWLQWKGDGVVCLSVSETFGSSGLVVVESADGGCWFLSEAVYCVCCIACSKLGAMLGAFGSHATIQVGL
jgi:hypothetical protein